MKIHDRYEYDPNQDLLGKGGFTPLTCRRRLNG
jgi:hypothetical protein